MEMALGDNLIKHLMILLIFAWYLQTSRLSSIPILIRHAPTTGLSVSQAHQLKWQKGPLIIKSHRHLRYSIIDCEQLLEIIFFNKIWLQAGLFWALEISFWFFFLEKFSKYSGILGFSFSFCLDIPLLFVWGRFPFGVVFIPSQSTNHFVL